MASGRTPATALADTRWPWPSSGPASTIAVRMRRWRPYAVWTPKSRSSLPRSWMMTGHERIDLGNRGEELAEKRLRALGYQIIARNVRSRYGELDLIAIDQGCYVFVEVRTRRSRQMAPEESITLSKRR